MGLSLRQQRAYQANIWKFYVYRTLMSFQLWMPIWVIYLQEERGLSLTQVTALDAPFWLIIVLSEVPTGAIADRWGRKTSLLLGSLFLAIGIFIFGVAENYIVILISYFAWAVALALQSGADSAFVYDSLKALGREEEYRKIFGRTWAVNSVGVLSGTAIGAPLAGLTNLAFPILLSAGIALVATLTAATFVEPREGDEAGPTLTYAAIVRESARLVVKMPPVRYMILLFAALSAGTVAPVILFQPFLLHHGIAVGQAGFWQLPARVAAIVGALMAHRAVLSLGERQTIYLTPILLVVSYVALATWDAVEAFIFFALVSFTSTMARPVISDYLNRRIPTSQRATILSLNQLMFSLALVVVEPALGALADAVSLTASFALSALLVALAAAIILTLWTRAEAEQAQEAPSPVPEA